ncbi:ABC transporter ATP-binding protein [Sulfitobacter sp. JL08]|uniref:ABC transporter ATP-binding protein n=1 Tax=Sulfitobacter sp. JL08 TaxID=2070369 RepID=UPI001965EEF3|nr:ABC transporter ATP-binding protein [Sulfitobacter sp. JL08]
MNDRTAAGTQDSIWALRNIDFEVKQGEIVGIIGRNGAGKSTLLKLLSRVTAPTEGRIYINGRIASLLEVGTGFHPELTGRENIFLNGAILGMTKAEIRLRFDEIVEFSGCAKYIDTPVKRYSSGMHVRLAFAVAAHLETDILIVDEVLAVGDAEFQSKCLGKMRDLSSSGHRTVFFVSHNMAAVRQLCPRSILMDKGTVVNIGETNAIIEQYMTMGSEADRSVTWPQDKAPSGDGIRLNGIFVKNSKGRTEGALPSDEDIFIEIKYTLTKEVRDLRVGVSLYNAEGTLIFVSSDYTAGGSGSARAPGQYLSRMRLPGSLLIEGRYVAEINAEIPRLADLVNGPSCSFEIDEMVHDGWGPKRAARLPGIIHPKLEWTVAGN